MTQTYKKLQKRTMTIVSLMLVLMLLASFVVVVPANAGACTWTYKVRPGDTLGLIAHLSGTKVNDILALNPQITDINLIFWGSSLCLSATLTPPPAYGKTYVVQLGDTVGFLVSMFGANFDNFIRTNGLGNPNVLFAGESLTVPTTPEPAG